jgi:hypothetical protein
MPMSSMKKSQALIVPLMGVVCLLGSQVSDAKGCIKGAVVGAVAGHVAGHHAVLGAAAGCVIGHHLAKKKQQEEQHQKPQSPQAQPRQEAGAGTETVMTSGTEAAGALAA